VFEPDEEFRVLRCVLNIDHDPQIQILIADFLMPPFAFDGLGQERQRSEPGGDFAAGDELLFRFNRPAVIVPGG
jgi:hypothetical protein